MTTLVATYLNPDDTACTGTVTFELSAAVYDSDQPAIRPQARLTETLDNTGSISVDLMPYDDPGLTLVGTLTYRVTERIGDAPVRRYYVAVPLDANPVDLGTLAPQGTPGAVTTAALVPAGGDDGQVLAKASDDDYDTEWVDQTGGGGTTVAGFPAATYTWKAASQSTDPGTGCIGVNNNDPGSATIMRVSATDGDSNDLHYGWQLLREGDSVSVVSDADDTKGYRWYVDGTITDNTTWLSIPIGLAVSLGGGEPTGDTDVKVLVYPTGGEVTSVNGGTGAVVLDPDDLDDTATTHKFTTAGDISKLAGIEAAADVTDATNVAAAGAVMATLLDAKGDIIAASAADTAARLAVGANGTVLTGSSGASTGLAWVSPTALLRPRAVDRWYPGIGGKADEVATEAPTVNREYALPWLIGAGAGIKALGVYCGTGGGSGSVVRVGVRSDDGSGKPGTLLVDGGTFASTGTGWLNAAFTWTSSEACLVWLIVVAQVGTSPSIQMWKEQNMFGDLIGGPTQDAAHNFTSWKCDSDTTGALPSSPSGAWSGSTTGPKVFVRAS